VGASSRRDHRQDAGSPVRRDDQSLVAVPGAVVSHVGALRVLSVEWRVRIPRSVAGCHGVRVSRPGHRARAHSARRGAAVRRGRRAALVAPAHGTRNAHSVLGRSRVAPVRRRSLHPHHGRRCRAGRGGAVHRDASARAARARGVRPADPQRAHRLALRALRERPAPRLHRGRARIAAHRLGRLERRDEPGGHRREG
jgi:cyclic beta-1,2-glucan synthetase